MNWQTSRRQISLDRPLVMAILNVTPDSFSDGGALKSVAEVSRQVEKMIGDGADIIDVGGESTRPGSRQVSIEEETKRVIPVIEAITKRFDTPVSIDTTKAEVARGAIDAGAEIINDISGLRFDESIAAVAADTGAGLVLMHSRGSFEILHDQPPAADILGDVCADFRRSVSLARANGITADRIVLDIGIGFGKTMEQNLELLAKLDKIVQCFSEYPILVGTSRKSFIGKLVGGAPPDERLSGSLATAAIAVFNGAKIVRVHDVKDTVDMLKVAAAITLERY